MFKKTTNTLFLAAMALLIFNCGDLHSCDYDSDHGPVCDDCSCINCSSSLNSPAISSQDWNATFCLLGDFKPINPYFKFGEIATDIDRPPRF